MNMLKKCLRRGLSCAALALGVVGLSAPGRGDPIPPGWAARNMEPVGYSAMGDRLGAFKMAIRKVNGRWYLYTGHLWHYGWSIVDVTDPKDPKLVKFIDFSPPFLSAGAQSVHTALPLWDRNLLFASSEASAERCQEALNFAGLIDNADPARPRLMSLFPLPAPPPGAPYRNFCEKGGRFGPHNVNQEIHLPDVEKPGNLIYLTYFTAGLRVFDIKDPLMPVETGWFIPPQPARNVGPLPKDLVTQTEDVLVDTRGYVYVADKNWGLWITRYTGPDQPAPTDR